MTTAYSILFNRLKCIDETSWEVGDDEVYAYLIAARFGSGVGHNISTKITRTPRLGSFDEGHSEWFNHRLYGIDSDMEPISYGGPVNRLRYRLFYILLMEDDSTNRVMWDLFETSVKLKMTQAIVRAQGSLQGNEVAIGSPTPQWRHNLISEVTAMIKAEAQKTIKTPDDDDEIIGLRRLVVYPDDLQQAQKSGRCSKTLTLKGDGGKYKAYFTIYARDL